jgi:glutamate carboxypeptidase
MSDFVARTPDMLALLKRLVETESPSHEKAAVDRVGAIVADECRRLGAQVEIHPRVTAGDLVEARWGSGMGGFLLLSHMDTVFPLGTLGKMPFYVKDGKAFGPGVSDMKGGIVVALTSLAAARATGSLSRPITALFTSDEETGSAASRALIEKLAAHAALVLVLEPAMLDGSLKTWRKGVAEFTVRVHGRAAHAGGDHEKGRNAIEEMAHQVLAIQKMTDYSRGTTLNVGVIHGGIASNVVPEEAVIEVDLRVLQPGEAGRITAAMQTLSPVLDGTTLEVTGELNRRPPGHSRAGRSRSFWRRVSLRARVYLRRQPSRACQVAHRHPARVVDESFPPLFASSLSPVCRLLIRHAAPRLAAHHRPVHPRGRSLARSFIRLRREYRRDRRPARR